MCKHLQYDPVNQRLLGVASRRIALRFGMTQRELFDADTNLKKDVMGRQSAIVCLNSFEPLRARDNGVGSFGLAR